MHKFSPDNALRLERPERYELIPPDITLRKLGLERGMTMIDIGAGTGFFSRAAAAIVAPEGRVYAADMSPQMLDHLRQMGIPGNVEVVHSTEYGIPLPPVSSDFSFLAFVLHETPDLPRFLKEVARVTKPGGTIAIVEWKKQLEERGPAEEERLDRQILYEHAKKLSPHCLAGDLNASHYYVIIRKPAQ